MSAKVDFNENRQTDETIIQLSLTLVNDLANHNKTLA